jgi:predicted nucleic acid-binding protein
MSGIGSNAVSDAFDADVLIYLARGDARAVSVRAAMERSANALGSVLLLPEVLSKPIAAGDDAQYRELVRILARLDLKVTDAEIADASALLGAKYRLRAADAIHLATAVVWGAERFHTNNRKDFGPQIEEVEVVWPE